MRAGRNPVFDWDDANVLHLARHGIDPSEAEDVVAGPSVAQRGSQRHAERYRVLGRTTGGRYLVILYDMLPDGRIRPFTGWEMNAREKAIYRRQVEE
jgi:uncharacterized DUF497 family protein